MRLFFLILLSSSIYAQPSKLFLIGKSKVSDNNNVVVPFEYGNLSELYPNETFEQIKVRRQANYDLLKSNFDYLKTIGGGVLINNDVEIYFSESDVMEVSSGESFTLSGDASIICFPYVPVEGENPLLFSIDYNASLTIDGVTLIRNNIRKYETYQCVLKVSGSTTTIEITEEVRPGFWAGLTNGKTLFYCWGFETKGEYNSVSSIDSVASTITTTSNISASVPSDVSGQYVNVGFYFPEDIPEDDYNTYGDLWHLNEGMFAVDSSFPNSPGSPDTNITLRNCTISGFEYNVNISSAACKLNLDNFTTERAQIGIAFFGNIVAGDQTITGVNGVNIQNNGYEIIGGIFAFTANNILGSGGYIHPNVQANIDTLVLSDNLAAAWRQYSSSGPKPVEGDYVSTFGTVLCSNNTEYDMILSNSMPTTIDSIVSTNVIYPGFNSTINGGSINRLALFSQSQPDAGVDNTITINNCEIRGYQSLSFSANRNQYTEVYYNNCEFISDTQANLGQIFISETQFLKYLEINNSTFVKGNGSYYTPGGSTSGLTACSRFIRPSNFKEVVINNMVTEYLYSSFVSNTNLEMVDFDNTIEINDSEINLYQLELYFPQFRQNLSKMIYGNNTIIRNTAHNTEIGYIWNTLFSPKVGTSTTKTITSGTYRRYGGNQSLSNVLEIGWDFNNYPVNAGTVRTIAPTLTSRSDLSPGKVICTNNYSGAVTIEAVGGDVVFEKFDASTNPWGNITNDFTCLSGQTCTLTPDPTDVLSTSANSSTTYVMGTANGTTTIFVGTITDTAKKLIVRGTVTVSAGGVSGVCDSDGNITGTGIVGGYVDMTGGTYYIEFTTAPTIGDDPTLSFDFYNNWKHTGTWTISG